MGEFLRISAMAVLLVTGHAVAGDIYTCKGAHGVNVYQNTPCAGTAELAHKRYSESMARAPAAPAYFTAGGTRLPDVAGADAAPESVDVAPPSYRAGGIGSTPYQRGEMQATRCESVTGKVYYTRGPCGSTTTATGMAPRAWQQDTVRGMPGAMMVGPNTAVNTRTGAFVDLEQVPSAVPTFRRTQDVGTAVDPDEACAQARRAAAGRFNKRADDRVQELCRFGRSMYDQPRSGRP